MGENKWIWFELYHEGDKTCKWFVIARKNDAVLGEIKWYGRWRQYAFFPVMGSVFNPDCMRRICEFISEEMEARKKK